MGPFLQLTNEQRGDGEATASALTPFYPRLLTLERIVELQNLKLRQRFSSRGWRHSKAINATIAACDALKWVAG